MAHHHTTMTNGVVVAGVETRGMITKAVAVVGDTTRVADVVDIVEIATITRTVMDRRMPITTRPIRTWEDMVEGRTTWAMVTGVDMATPVHPREWIITACNSNNREEEDMADSPTKTMITKSPVSTSRVEGSSSSPICTNNPWACRVHPLIPIPEEPQAGGHPGSKIGVETGSRRPRDIDPNLGQFLSLFLPTSFATIQEGGVMLRMK